MNEPRTPRVVEPPGDIEGEDAPTVEERLAKIEHLAVLTQATAFTTRDEFKGHLAAHPTRDSFLLRLSSRKFILAVATAAGVILASVADAITPQWAALLAAISTSIYVLAEAYTDGQAAAHPHVVVPPARRLDY
jgi:hypothetical protein